MPAHDDGATHSGAGVRKPAREETAGGGAKQRVRRYGIFGAGDLLPACVEQLFGKRKGWRAQLADRDRQYRRGTTSSCATWVERSVEPFLPMPSDGCHSTHG